jgi:hypothetical protein
LKSLIKSRVRVQIAKEEKLFHSTPLKMCLFSSSSSSLLFDVYKEEEA